MFAGPMLGWPRITGQIRRVGVAGLIVGLIAACGGSAGDSNDLPAQQADADDSAVIDLNDAPVVAESDDGQLTLSVPAGAMPADTELSISVFDGDGADLYGIAASTPVYELQPAGLQFSEPAVAELRMPLPDRWRGGVPILVGALASDGEIDLTDQNDSSVDADELVVRAEIAHFSYLSFFGDAMIVKMEPMTFEGPPNSTFDVWVYLVSAEDHAANPDMSRSDRAQVAHLDLVTFRDSEYRNGSKWEYSEPVYEAGSAASEEGGRKRNEMSRSVGCTNGTGTFEVKATLSEAIKEVWSPFKALGDHGFGFFPDDAVEAISYSGTLQGTATCTDNVATVSGESDDSEADDTGSGTEIGRPDPPNDIYPPVGIEVAQLGVCGWPTLYPPEGALVQPHFRRENDTKHQRGEGYSLVLGAPHGAFVQFDEDGNLTAGIEPRGEPPWSEWEIVEVTHTDTTITIVVDETRYDEGGPCTQRVTYVYSIGNVGEILGYMDGIPADDIPEVGFDGVKANYEDGTFWMEGKLTFEDGVVVDLWLECSGLNLIEYRLIPIEVAPDGSFRIEEDFSDCIVINLVVAANGNQVTRSVVSK